MDKKQNRNNKSSTSYKYSANMPFKEGALIALDLSNNKGVTTDQIQTDNYVLGTRARQIAYSECNVMGIRCKNTTPKDDDGKYDIMIDSIYQTLRAANNGRIQYGKSDVGNYIFTVANLHSLRAVMSRAYKALPMFNVYDNSRPQLIYAGMELDYDTFKDNASDLRIELYNLDVMIARNFPLRLPLFDRKRYIYGEVFRESNEAKTALYVMYPDTIDYINKDSSGNSQCVKRNARASAGTNVTGITYQSFISMVHNVESDIKNYELYANIAADILKVYGQESIYKAKQLPEFNDKYEGVYDLDFLIQVHNANIFNCIGHDSDGTAQYGTYSDNGSFGPTGYKYDYRVAVTKVAYIKNDSTEINHFKSFLSKPSQLLATPKNSPDKSDIISMGSLSFRMDWNLTSSGGVLSGTLYCQDILFEVPMEVDYWAIATSSGLLYRVSATGVGGVTTYLLNLTGSSIDTVLQVEGEVQMKMGSYSYHPRIIKVLGLKPSGSEGYDAVYYSDWDYYNCADVDEQHLQNLHSIFIQSAMHTPTLVRDVRLESLVFTEN